jgi:hypothetical protein
MQKEEMKACDVFLEIFNLFFVISTNGDCRRSSGQSGGRCRRPGWDNQLTYPISGNAGRMEEGLIYDHPPP